MRVSAENVAIVKASWAGWRQHLRDQMLRDLGDGVADRIDAWNKKTGTPELQPLEFVDAGDKVLVCAAVVGEHRFLWFNYALDGSRIIGWDVYEKESKARKAAGLPR